MQLNLQVRLKLTFSIDERHQCNLPGALDGESDITLLFGGESGNPPWQQLAPFGDKFPEQFDIFVINGVARLDRGQTLAKVSHDNRIFSELVYVNGYANYLISL